MTRIAIHGAAGRMGQSIAKVIIEHPDASLVAAMDREGHENTGADMGSLVGLDAIDVKVGSDIEEFLQSVEVVIDFSSAEATTRLLPICAAQRIPMVIGTTGLGDQGVAAVNRAAEHVPLVYAPNYSQGVTALFHLAARAAELLGSAFDAEIVEMHHRHKVDAPSGTALRLAEVVAGAKSIDLAKHATHGRSGMVGARPDAEIGVMTLRGGDVVGEHTLYLQGNGERIELTHRATDRTIFARGAVRAALWAAKHVPGRYDMFDVMGVPRS